MHVVYEAENVIDAHLVRGRLAAEGITAFVRGEFLAGAMGELPVSGLLAVWVPEEQEATRAEVLLEAWRSEPPLADEEGGAEAFCPAILPA